MSVQPLAGRHHRAIIALHWGTLALIVVGVVAILIREIIDDDSLRQLLLGFHRGVGALLLVVVCVRIPIRMLVPTPITEVDRRLRLLSTLVHFAIYGLLLAIPVLGWLLTNAHGQPVAIAGLVPLPTLMTKDRDLADVLAEWHEGLAWALLALIASHALAALWHHYARRDGVLASMLPLFPRRAT